MGFDQQTELFLLEALETDPETTQADLAAKVGVAVGTVNWYLKRWSAKGYVKVKRIGRWRWRYLLTPQGMAEKARLAGKYVDASMRIYRQTREESRRLMEIVKVAGYETIVIADDNEIGDICRLTGIELGIQSVNQSGGDLPVIRVDGFRLSLEMPVQRVNDDGSGADGR